MLTIKKAQSLNFLKPGKVPRLSREQILILNKDTTPTELNQMLGGYRGIVALDIETNAKPVYTTESFIQGIGLSNNYLTLYADRRVLSTEVWDTLLAWISTTDVEFAAHNVMYDSAFIYRDTGKWVNWKYCTYGLYKQLATEGYDGQTWGLKGAQTELLGWSETNEEELDNWLIDSGYVKSYSVEPTESGYLRELPQGPRYCSPDKSKMSEAPPDILGYYCGLDAYSTYQLLAQVLLPSLNQLEPSAKTFFNFYHSEVFIINVKLLVEQLLGGIYIDKPALENYYNKLDSIIEEKRLAFFEMPEVKQYISKREKLLIDTHLAKEPKKYKDIPLPKEPAKFKKDGTVSKGWLTYEKRMEEYPALLASREPSLSWLNWNAKLEEIKTEDAFNLNSPHQLRELFYNELKYPIILTTDSGSPATDKSALRGFGVHGKALREYSDKVKEKAYVSACLEKIKDTGFLHPQFRTPGTLTGRLAGTGKFNVQQQPKSREYLETFRARPGHVWIQADINSLEQVVLAELSQDQTLHYLYGSGVTNDVYLFNGANLKGIGERIREYYDPHNPTPESIALAKKECKRERNIAKVLTLSASYGAGPQKIHQTLSLDGVKITLEEVQQLHRDYWELYAGVKEYGRRLFGEWNSRKGWIYNGLGRPLAVHKDKTKDLVNRVCQSTGHDILMIVNYYLENLKQESGNPNLWYPIIIDYHDEGIVECLEEDKDKVIECFNKAYELLNNFLKGNIKLVSEPAVILSLADAKCEPLAPESEPLSE